jgi:alkanesulfonate monooxygenase SsuD/methylene tetrahydromethanopterin reductase-like flavin-dependent oxidoreductase (luciferase family)
MGSAASNFYNDAFGRQGFAEDVAEVQRLWAAGDREAAAARVPIEIGLGTNLIGPPDVVRDRLRAHRDAGVTTLRIAPIGATFDDHVAGLEQLLDLLATVNGERPDQHDTESKDPSHDRTA